MHFVNNQFSLENVKQTFFSSILRHLSFGCQKILKIIWMTLDKKTSKKNSLLLLQQLEERLRQDIFPLNFMAILNKTDMKGNGKKGKISEIGMGASEKQKFYHH